VEVDKNLNDDVFSIPVKMKILPQK